MQCMPVLAARGKEGRLRLLEAPPDEHERHRIIRRTTSTRWEHRPTQQNRPSGAKHDDKVLTSNEAPVEWEWEWVYRSRVI